ncbi:MAG TPA: amino acid ABC transporter ATP-binding protein [Thermoplasmatales archaeon]|nr:amino acid ABC transporter ATP-binding protein [Thermoplasmatales archaeon]
MYEEILKVVDLKKRFGNNEVLKGVSFSIGKGETKVVIGPSGAGKSTMLRCINRLVEPDGGKIYFKGNDITSKNVDIKKIRSRIGFVFQHFNLFKHLTALDNVKIGLKIVKKMSDEEATERAYKALEMVKLEDCASKYPAQLSGGQQQRVAIARALAMDPEIILFDEPTSALDPELVGEVLDVMKELSKKHVTMLVVTHEIGFALGVADEILFFYDGVIWERGKPQEIIYKPKKKETKDFLRRIFELYSRGEEE